MDFTLWDIASWEWLQSDAVFLQSILTWAAMVNSNNGLRKDQSDNRLGHHLHRTITILNGRLSERDMHLQDSTLYVVLTLALVACSMGDRAALRAHLLGLHRIVQLRGDIPFLLKHPMLYLRINQSVRPAVVRFPY